MPGSQPYTHIDSQDTPVFTISVDDDLEPRRSVYFTDQSPVFDVSITNHTERELKIPVRIDLRVEDHNPSQSQETSFEQGYGLFLSADETVVRQYEPGLIPLQGSAVLGVRGPGYRDPELSEDEECWVVEQNAGISSLSPLHTFMVYDRDFYAVNYLWTRRAQYVSAGLAVLIVLVGVLQLLA